MIRLDATEKLRCIYLVEHAKLWRFPSLRFMSILSMAVRLVE